jgi:hypothetical protein
MFLLHKGFRILGLHKRPLRQPPFCRIAISSDNHGFPNQFGVSFLFDGREKGIHIDVKDSSHLTHFNIPGQTSISIAYRCPCQFSPNFPLIFPSKLVDSFQDRSRLRNNLFAYGREVRSPFQMRRK